MSYPGGKGASGVVQTIINQQPPHDSYIEPFLGGGAIIRAKLPARHNEALDLDPDPLDAFNDRARFPYPRFQFHNACGLSFLAETQLQWGSRDLVYCDPPYPLSARCRRNRRLYRYEMNDHDHRSLLILVRSLRCMVQISSYWNPLYAQMLEGWRLIRFQAMTRGGLKEECLWMNYPEPVVLHDYRFLGVDYRERERIRRKTARWTARIAALPKLERLALLSAMIAETSKNGEPGSRGESSDVRRPSPAASTLLATTDRSSAEMAGGSAL